eukprot:scaffold68748_cov29-Tisochrysis_lutea.AAC.3
MTKGWPLAASSANRDCDTSRTRGMVAQRPDALAAWRSTTSAGLTATTPLVDKPMSSTRALGPAPAERPRGPPSQEDGGDEREHERRTSGGGAWESAPPLLRPAHRGERAELRRTRRGRVGCVVELREARGEQHSGRRGVK